MDGQQDEKHRQTSISMLNGPKSEVKVLLASLKACSEGINLVGANRVVLLDVHWNPSAERQAISRAYRLGQEKIVYVYHLVTGLMEGEKYIRQVEKTLLSELVFCSNNKDGSSCKISTSESGDRILEAMVQHERLQHMFEKVIYQPKEADLVNTFGSI
ncbi:SNF2 domain-containing protein CLASSY 3-like [Rutidosis leptorrhynchoides]|uniref:SNF2 domain-containing protein CLASSY 3-like n=1 Tax=Rutidosis leptorrhynchoides TaxID=125765 RepID=UPI003A99BE30